MPKLNNWGVLAQDPRNPKEGFALLTGNVVGHANKDNCPDGDFITTSAVQMLDPKGHQAVTNNTTYELGEPGQEWLDFLDERKLDIEIYEFDKRN